MELLVATIMRVARWGSAIVLRYLGDAPLLTLTTTYIRNHQRIADRARTAAAHNWQGEPEESYDSSKLLLDAEPEVTLDYAYIQHRQTMRTHVADSAQLEFLSLRPLETLCRWTANLDSLD